METILVGYDGSEAAKHALTRAAEIAEALHARVVVLAVARPESIPAAQPLLEGLGPSLAPAGPTGLPVPVEPTPRPPETEPEDPTQRMLEQARAALPIRGVEVDYVSALGDPAEAILEAADEQNADLIVVGSRVHGFLERLLGGAVDEKVAREAHRDVLLVH
jgi:nucleotide-binding universal stress UspA family protein